MKRILVMLLALSLYACAYEEEAQAPVTTAPIQVAEGSSHCAQAFNMSLQRLNAAMEAGRAQSYTLTAAAVQPADSQGF